MNIRRMSIIEQHFQSSFGQPINGVLHPDNTSGLHIDILMFEPTEKFPFWKLATMGASQIVMPQKDKWGNKRNEYVLFADKAVDMKNDYDWYAAWLINTAMYTYNERQFVTFTHTLEQMPDNDPFSEMEGVILLLPAVINENIFQCKLGLSKKFTCLQVMPINKQEIDETYAQNSMMGLVCKFYPFLSGNEEDQEKPCNYLAEKVRSF